MAANSAGTPKIRRQHARLVMAALLPAVFAASAGIAAAQNDPCEPLRRRIDQRQQQLEAIERYKALLPRLRAARDQWAEFERVAGTGIFPARLKDRRFVDAAGRQIAELFHESMSRAGRRPVEREALEASGELFVEKLQRQDAAAIEFIRGIEQSLASRTEDMLRELDQIQRETRGVPLADMYRQMQACEGRSAGDAWEKALGRWVNDKGTYIIDVVYRDGVGLEGEIVKPAPTWPKSIVPGTVYFRSRVTRGETMAANVQGGDTIIGNCIQVPQGNDCPKLAPRFDRCTLRIDTASGLEIVKTQTTRLYDAKACKWSEKTQQDTVTWRRITK